MSHSTLSKTPTDLTERIATIAALSPEVLSNTTKKELDKLVVGIIPRSRDLRKLELLEVIETLVAPIRLATKVALEQEAVALEEQRLQLLAQAANFVPDGDIEPNSKQYREVIAFEDEAIDLFNNLKTIATKAPDLQTLQRDSMGLATQLLFSWSLQYKPTTVKSKLTETFKTLEKLGQELPDNDKAKSNTLSALLLFKSTLTRLFVPMYNRIKTEYKDNVATRVDQRAVIDPSALLSKVEVILADERSSWKDLAVALALATGRRMAEVMSCMDIQSSGKPDTVLISGLAKKMKLDTETYMELPCIIPSELVIKGFQRLVASGKRLDASQRNLVNDNYAKTLSREVSKWQSECCPYVKLTYKSLRALYATICYDRYGDERYQPKYFSEILGHAEGDLTTAGSYEVFVLRASLS